jgi:hypothetical protein
MNLDADLQNNAAYLALSDTQKLEFMEPMVVDRAY